MDLVGANKEAEASGFEKLPGKSNYFIGNDPKQWHTNVPTYSKVRYRGVYPGVDLVYYGNQRQLEYDFVVSPGSDPRSIRLQFEGAKRIRVDEQNGDLVLNASGGEVRFQKPVVYQESGKWSGASGQVQKTTDSGSRTTDNHQSSIEKPVLSGARDRKFLDSRYKLVAKSQVRFEIPDYDRTRPLIIDPVLSFSTYLGGSNTHEGFGIAVDSVGSAYVSGYTYSANFPTLNPIQGAISTAPDAFVTKLSPSGSSLAYSTYLGGNNTDVGYGIALDSSGDAFVAGYTYSTNFPTMNPIQSANGDPPDAFISELNAAGSALVYSTYLGGNSTEQGFGIAVGTSGAYVTGLTCSSNFPTKNALQPALAACYDAFVCKLVPSSYAGLSPKSLNFGTITVGTSTTQTVTLTNTGELPLNISSIAITGTNASDYALAGSGTCPYAGGTMAVGDSCTIDVIFAPLVAYTRNAAVTLTDDASGNPQTVSLTGYGAGPVVSINPLSYDFGNEVVGLTTNKSFSVVNTGNATLNVSSITVNSSDYSIYNGCSILPAGNGCYFYVYFAPTSIGTKNATVTLTDNATPGTQSVSVTGTGLPTPVVNLSPTSLNFGLVPINTTSVSQPVTLSNTAGSTLLISSIQTNGLFSQTNNCGGSVPVGSSCTINVSFTPTAATQGYGGTLYVYDNTATGSPQTVSLSGTGQGPLGSWNPAMLSFPRQALNTTSASQSATFRNNGNGAMTISSIAPAFRDFSQTNNCPSTLAAGANCTFTVTFTPTGTGPRTGAVSVSDDAVNSPHSLSLLGNPNYLFNRLDLPTGGNSGHGAAVGDFNGDGRPDMAVPDSNTNAVSILLGAPDGKFQNKVDYSTGTNPVAVAVGDFNSDGDQDLVTANYNGNTVSVLLGNGDGTFLAAVNYAGSGNPQAVVTGDFNGDRKTDIAYANYSGSVTVRLGTGSGSFGAGINASTGLSYLWSLATAARLIWSWATSITFPCFWATEMELFNRPPNFRLATILTLW